MPSSWSPSLRFELQFTGENINLWGDKLNAVLAHADYAVAGWLTKPLTGNTSLTTANAGDDEARAAMIKFTGAGPFTVTVPAVSKAYTVWNACAGAVTLTTGGGSTVAVGSGEICQVICDGTSVKRVAPIDYGSLRLQNLGDPTGAQDAATKAYVDAQSFAAAGGNLPGQAGNSGKFLTTNGSVASWADPLPSQSSNSGKFLKTNGSTSSWAQVASADIDFSAGINMDGATKAAVHALSGTSIDVSTGEWFTKAISSGATFTFGGAIAGKAQGFLLELTISGGAVPSWPGSVDWGGAVAPTLGNGVHVLGFVTFNGGTDWTGFVGAKARG